MTMTPPQARDHILADESKAIRVDGSIDLSGTNLKAINCSLACNDLNLSGTAIETLSSEWLRRGQTRDSGLAGFESHEVGERL